MSYKPKIVLQLPLSAPEKLEPFVEACLAEGVELIAVVGDGCERVHDEIDEIIVGDGSDDTRFITTSWHENETVDDALEFAGIFGTGAQDAVQLVRL